MELFIADVAWVSAKTAPKGAIIGAINAHCTVIPGREADSMLAQRRKETRRALDHRTFEHAALHVRHSLKSVQFQHLVGPPMILGVFFRSSRHSCRICWATNITSLASM